MINFELQFLIQHLHKLIQHYTKKRQQNSNFIELNYLPNNHKNTNKTKRKNMSSITTPTTIT